jgi:glucokinase
MHYLGIEIGGTKLQLGVGPDDGRLRALWRGNVDPSAGPDGIRRQIASAVPELLAKAGLPRDHLRGVGVGFGGPVDDETRTVITSHQIAGWDGFPLGDWIADLVGVPAVLGNDADVAGLAEALHGAGKGLSPIFYITVGSGIGGGLIIGGEIHRGVGRGAAEVGHVRIPSFDSRNQWGRHTLEALVSGWALEEQARAALAGNPEVSPALLARAEGRVENVTTRLIGEAAASGDPYARGLLRLVPDHLADALTHVIALVCPRRIVIGGGVSLVGEELFFAPLRALVAERAFGPFAGLTDIVPAALGEEVVVHGAVALAHKRLG